MQSKEKKFEPIKMPVKAKASQDNQIQKSVAVEKQHQQKKAAKQQINQVQDEKIEFEGKTNKESIASDILKNGFVQSYSDFFYITNETVPYLFQQPAAMSIQDHFHKNQIFQKHINQNEDFLMDLKRKLQQAEESTKYSLPDKTHALEGYLHLAEHFYNEYQDYIVSAYFYKRVIHIAKLHNENRYEGKGQLGYGRCHYQVGLIDQAIHILELSMKECEIHKLETVMEQMSTELIKIYNRMASEYEKGEADQIAQALIYYEKCREAAQKGGDLEAEGVICNKIGGLYFKMQNLQRSIQYHNKFLEIVKQLHKEDSKQKEMEAHSSLAKCYIKKGDMDEAQKHLESYHSIAKDQKFYNFQSDAALHLAKLFQQKGNTAKSLEYFQQHFDCAKSEKPDLKSRSLIDRARVTYGIAKANAFMENFIKLVGNSDKNLKALLDWKSKRDK